MGVHLGGGQPPCPPLDRLPTSGNRVCDAPRAGGVCQQPNVRRCCRSWPFDVHDSPTKMRETPSNDQHEEAWRLSVFSRPTSWLCSICTCAIQRENLDLRDGELFTLEHSLGEFRRDAAKCFVCYRVWNAKKEYPRAWERMREESWVPFKFARWGPEERWDSMSSTHLCITFQDPAIKVSIGGNSVESITITIHHWNGMFSNQTFVPGGAR